MTGVGEINVSSTFSSVSSMSDLNDRCGRDYGQQFASHCGPEKSQQQQQREKEDTEEVTEEEEKGEEQEEEMGQEEEEEDEEGEHHHRLQQQVVEQQEEEEEVEQEQQGEDDEDEGRTEGVGGTGAVENYHYSSSACGDQGAYGLHPTALSTLVEPAALAKPAEEAVAGSTALSGMQEEREPLFRFGAIADVQYSDREDGWNFAKSHRRYYRGGLVQLRRAVDCWLRDGTIRFALQLGDVIDGCNRLKHGHSKGALASVKGELDRLAEGLPLGVLNSLGNHELYNFSKRHWAREIDCSSLAKAVALAPSTATQRKRRGEAGVEGWKLVGKMDGEEEEKEKKEEKHAKCSTDSNGRSAIPEVAEERFYYSFCPHPSYRLVSLDTYDVNAIRGEPERRRGGGGGREERDGGGGGDPQPQRSAVEMLSEINPNEDKNDAGGMEGLSTRFVQYNGGVGKEQLLWLENELSEATAAGQRVIAFGHVPIHPIEAPSNCLVWNYKDVLEVMHTFDCVAMFLSGHRHLESYCRDAKGIHHVSLAAALEAPPGQEAFARIDVHPDCLRLQGHGAVESRFMTLV